MNLKFIFTIAAFLSATMFFSQNYVNFPDANFKAALINNPEINTDGDEEISIEEALSTTKIHIYNDIKDLTGIEHFANLTSLRLDRNQLTSIDLSNNLKLKELSVNANQLSSIDLSQNQLLEKLYLNDNNISEIDFSNNLKIKILSIRTNNLKTINVSNLNNLVLLDVSYNEISSIDLKANTELISLLLSNNKLTQIDLSLNRKLIELFSSANQLSSIDLSQNQLLEDLDLSNNHLEGLLDLKNNIELQSSLVVNNNPYLTCIQLPPSIIIYPHSFIKDETANWNCDHSSLSVKKNHYYEKEFIVTSPVRDNLIIKSTKSSSRIKTISIYTTTGQLVRTFNPSNQNLNISDLPVGVYILIISTEQGSTHTDKFIKE
ncbi:T9SS type A sorting domain-containing protein [Bergeyella sp. RCAD1439]|uniref:T9SS type A sorting domain-containing protein n=1 Tax=Bergeyella anatis TaxID=3113737 RepID=UPI002E19D15D|nr:T9SS type A sorting domain-containing protein [Bergeyella sp. RCAD1439]